MPNPWIIVGFLVALIGATIGGYSYGKHVENLEWTAKVERQKTEAATELAKKTDEVRRKEADLAAIKDKYDKETIANEARINSAAAETRAVRQRLDDALGRLREQGRGKGGGGSMPGAADPSGRCQHLQALVDRLSGAVARLAAGGDELAGDAERDATVAGTCARWATEVRDTP